MGRKFPFCGSDTPADGVVVGDLWVDTTSTPVVKVCTSVDPVVFTDYTAELPDFADLSDAQKQFIMVYGI